MERLDATVLICTYNRARYLGEALDSLAALPAAGRFRFEVLVVDYNSSDGTPRVVRERQTRYPVPLRYVFERQQGRSAALNAGIAASLSPVLVVGDDDQRYGDHWVDRACAPLIDRDGIDYAGGPVRPIWSAPSPAWLDLRQSELCGPLGVFDYGKDPFIYEDRRRPAPGGNIAIKRALIERIGGFRVELGRTAGSLLGQEQVEFLMRAGAAGARGLYVPDLEVFHHVPPERMTRAYFRRWWYWRGVSRARLDRIHPVTDTGVDLAGVPRVLNVPRFMYRGVLRDAAGWIRSLFGRAPAERLAAELRLLYFVGYFREQRGAQGRSGRAQSVSRHL
jgi:glycosyltransferase involved in cell wall biosynthesis